MVPDLGEDNRLGPHAEYVERIEEALFAKSQQLLRSAFIIPPLAALLLPFAIRGGWAWSRPWLFSRQRREVMPLVLLYIDGAAWITVLLAAGIDAWGLSLVKRPFWPVLWFLGLGLALMAVYYGLAVINDRLLKFRIAGSDIANLLLETDGRLERIYRYSPALFGFSILGFRVRGLEDAARLVAVNADWYLRRPRFNFRAGWLAPLIQLGATLMLVFGWHLEVSPFILFRYLMVGIYAALLWYWELRRQAISLNRFWEYMQWRFDLDYL